jgi:hypothetical protein
MDEEAAGPLDDPGYHIYLATSSKKYAETLFAMPFVLAINTVNSMGNWFINVFSGNAEIEPVAEVNIFTMPLDITNYSENRIGFPISISTSIGTTGMFEIKPYVEVYVPDEDFLDLGMGVGGKAGIGPFSTLAEVKVGVTVEAPTYGRLGTVQYRTLGKNLPPDERNEEYLNYLYRVLKGDYFFSYGEF